MKFDRNTPFDPIIKDLTGVEARIAMARRDNARLQYQTNLVSQREKLIMILKRAGADSASQLRAVVEIEELFGVEK